ncbi:DUF2157 domain-containing protein [Arenicella xantha]|uniref:Putative membrane protein DUF2157 n=1 Tax=Arenicella xantha TaxID=644221 RepID=A0A395JH41_9GAMM|nr:DUF2157 domain-containing protein [Arenicella xantha]RBP48859.1 putative membrane protein DUF2157 [Arenicella xantha]
MPETHRKWLKDELPALVDDAVLDQDNAQRLRNHYQLDSLAEASRSVSLITIILAAFGGLLVGGGIILIFAHNWEHFGRTTRAILAFLPLLVAQGLTLYSVMRKPNNQAWLETAGALLFCAVPASISIIGQTYHLSNDTQSFLTWWFVLLVPFIYWLRSHLLASLMLALSVCLIIAYQSPYWLALLMLAPYYWLVKHKGFRLRTLQFGWLFAIAYAIACPFLLFKDQQSQLVLLSFISGAAVLYFTGVLMEHSNRFRDKPCTNIGAIAMSITALVLTYQEPWSDQRHNTGVFEWSSITASGWHDHTFAIGLILTALTLLGIVIKRSHWRAVPIGSLVPLILILLILPFAFTSPVIPAAVITIAVIGLGIWYVQQGIALNSTSQLNFGLLLLMTLLTLRFFDQDLSFIARGVAFIAMGLTLIGMNIWHSRRKSA